MTLKNTQALKYARHIQVVFLWALSEEFSREWILDKKMTGNNST